MNVQISLNTLSYTTGNICTLHLTFPNENVPYNSTNILELNKSVDFILNDNTHCVAVIHIYNYNNTELKHRVLFQPQFNKQSEFFIDGKRVIYEITFTSESAVPIVFTEKDISQTKQRLQMYIQMQYSMLQQYQPRRDSLRLKHSLNYTLESNVGQWNIPYVTIATRGHKVLQNLTDKRWNEYKSFFFKDIVNFFKNVLGYRVTSIIQTSYKAASNDMISLHSMMRQIAAYFSHFIHTRIKYKSDYSATGMPDFVGLNQFHDTLFADCEDIAACGYDVIRIFRKIFDADITDLQSKDLHLAHHIGAWLNHSDVALCQGCVKHEGKEINHVWCVIMSHLDVPFVVVEGTREASDDSKYKEIVRTWMMKDDDVFDLLMINPQNNTYGLEMGNLLHNTKARHVFKEWSHNLVTDAVKKDILFAGNIVTETCTIFDKL